MSDFRQDFFVGSEFDWGWFVGWLEGDAAFVAGLYESGLNIGVQATCRDADVIRRAHLLVPTSTMIGPLSPPSEHPHWSVQWKWGVWKRHAATSLMESLHPMMSDRRRAQIEAALALEASVPRRPPRRHGTYTMYRASCRCRPCRDANAAFQRRWRAKKAAR